MIETVNFPVQFRKYFPSTGTFFGKIISRFSRSNGEERKKAEAKAKRYVCFILNNGELVFRN